MISIYKILPLIITKIHSNIYYPNPFQNVQKASLVLFNLRIVSVKFLTIYYSFEDMEEKLELCQNHM